MLKDITLGQFFPGNSVLHRMDPRMKIIPWRQQRKLYCAPFRIIRKNYN